MKEPRDWTAEDWTPTEEDGLVETQRKKEKFQAFQRRERMIKVLQETYPSANKKEIEDSYDITLNYDAATELLERMWYDGYEDLIDVVQDIIDIDREYDENGEPCYLFGEKFKGKASLDFGYCIDGVVNCFHPDDFYETVLTRMIEETDREIIFNNEGQRPPLPEIHVYVDLKSGKISKG